MTISLCMIVRDEEDVLARCLDSIQEAVDEIIIVDTGSVDSTKEIARRYTQRVYDFEWIDDFSAARNAAFGYATMDYQMWLDADDVVPPRECLKLRELKETLDPTVDVVTMLYNTAFDEQGVPIFTSRRERLLKREKNFRWNDPVHECIAMSGNIHHSDIVIEHHKEKQEISYRNLRIYQGMEEAGKPFSPRQLYYYARELKDHQMYGQAAERFERFLDDGLGWTEDNIAACYALAVCRRETQDRDGARAALIRAFAYGGPRAEIACELGYHFKAQGDIRASIEWFRAAANAEHPDNGGFMMRDYWGYIPNLELCVLSFMLGDIQSAREYNELAGLYKPDSPAVLRNRKFLAEQME